MTVAALTTAGVVLGVMRIALFALALALTYVSFRAYRSHRSKRLEYAFVGFAFVSMGVAMTNMSVNLGRYEVYYQIAMTVPFLVGFTMLYVSLYR